MQDRQWRPRGATLLRSLALLAGLAATSESRAEEPAAVAAAPTATPPASQIYFGDLHTHTNISADAVLMQLAHGVERGPEAACTYAAACAAVDFYGQSDHAEMTDRADWERIQAAVRDCNEVGKRRASDGADPTIVAFQGFEWTSSMKGVYWGHKNVFFKNDLVTDMPIASGAIGEMEANRLAGTWITIKAMWPLDPPWGQAWRTFRRSLTVNDRIRCDDDADGYDCVVVAPEPKDLFAQLNAQFDRPGFDALVIPHGTAWGMAKVGADWDIQLNPEQHDSNLQTLVEVYSGHGNSEEWRDFSAPDTTFRSCHDRAAELQAAQCKQDGTPADACKPLITQARQSVAVPFETSAADWGDCGQCMDCFQPSERYQPDGSVQAALAKSGFSNSGSVETRYRFGFIGATDDHAGKPASVMESRSIADWGLAIGLQGTFESEFIPEGRNRVEAERLGSFFYPGGLVAIHADGRTRDQLWQGLRDREVYGTSGPRIELWFDASGRSGEVAMGGQLLESKSPTFTVTVHGGPEELPGCSQQTVDTWGREVVEGVCQQTCFNPGDRRSGIERLEIVRIRPQVRVDEPLGSLIDDPWLVIDNPGRAADGRPAPTMTTSFTDPDFAQLGRDTLYYVRALQEKTMAVNGTPLRDQAGNFAVCNPYYDGSDDCASAIHERAWSSPIYVDYLSAE